MAEAKPPQRASVPRMDPPPQEETYQESLAAADRELRAWLRRQSEQRAQRRNANPEVRPNPAAGPPFAETGLER